MAIEESRSMTLRAILAAGASAAAMTVGAASYAQDDVDQIDRAVAAEAAEDTDTIVVTGSRIRRSAFDEIFPSTTIDEEYLDDRAFTNIADALAEIPSFGGGFDDTGAQGGTTVGQSFVDFLDLGTARTLVLVDGRRFVTSSTAGLGGANGTQVDTNAIPVGLIERVEVIGIGGAPVYGSDAIAGTINFILKDDYEGAEFTAQYGATTARGDASSLFGQFLAGANFDDGRGNVTFTLQYEDQDGLLQTDRNNIFAPRNEFFFSEFAGQDGDDPAQQALFNNRFINIFTNGGVASPGATFIPTFGLGALGNDGGFVQFNESGELVPFEAGLSIPGQSAFFARGGDGSNLFQETGSLLTPAERLSSISRFRYDITENVEAFADVTFANTVATEQVNQGGFQSFAFGGTSAPLTFNIDNPLLTEQARGVLIASGISDDDDDGDGVADGTFVLNRLNNDLIDSADSVETSLWRFSGGLRGEFEAAGRGWSWDASFTHGESDLEITGDFIIDQSFLNAIDVVTLTQDDVDEAGGLASINGLSGVTVDVGDPVCRSVIEAATGERTGASGNGVTDADLPFVQNCAPLDVFGLNRASAEAISFITGPSQILNDNTSSQLVFNLASTLFELPGGPVQFNIGFENRFESGQFVPSVADQIALGRATASPANGGSYRTNEYYGELSVPLVSPDLGIPFVDLLVAEGSYRRIEPNSFNDAEAFSVGGRWRPYSDLTIRGNYTEAFRLPSIAELFSPQSGAFVTANDPCDFRFFTEGPDSALRLANCQAAGIDDPANFTSNIVNATALGATGGNPNLNPETSEAWTVGAEWRPSFIKNLEIGVDYYAVEIQDAIVGVSLTQILNACFDSNDFANEPNCQAFTRDDDGQIVDFLTGQANAGTFDTEFLQIQARYGWDLSEGLGLVGLDQDGADRGYLRHTLNIFSPQKRDFAVGDEDPGLNNTLGGFGDPNVSLNFSTRYELGNFGAFWGVLWQDNPLVTANPLNDDEFFNIAGPVGDFETPGLVDGRLPSSDAITKGDGDQFIHNASISYNLEDVFGSANAIMQLTVNNVFDRSPSVLENALGDFGQSQILGRNYVLTLRTQF